MFRALMAADARVKLQTDNDKMMLLAAAERGYSDIVRFLVAMNASVLIRGAPHRNTCLHVAAQGGHVETVRELVKW